MLLPEVAHQLALVPLAAVVLARHRLPREYWLVGLAFLASWLGDMLASLYGGSWLVSYLWLPAQVALVLMVVLPTALSRLLSPPLMALLAGVSWLISAPGPDVLVTVVGSTVILRYAQGRLARPLQVYFGAGTVAYLIMATLIASPHFMLAWYVYQTCRLTAFVLFTLAVVQAVGE